MAYGDSSADPALREAWGAFCDRLKEAGELVFRDAVPTSVEERALGFQYLSRLTRHSLERMVENADPLHPLLWRYMSPSSKWGGDNPDSLYLVTAIDGSRNYRIHGDRGTAHYAVFSAQRPWDSGKPAEAARLLGSEIEAEPDGRFELFVGPDERQGNWLQTTPDTYRVMIRQFFYDWETERPAQLYVELEGEDEPVEPITVERITDALSASAEWVHMNHGVWYDWQLPNQKKLNRFLDLEDRITTLGGVPGGRGLSCSFEIEPDEALLIEVTPPRCHFWNMELGTFWMMSHDYRYRLSSWNGHQAAVEADGSVRLAVAHRDPGLHNWLDTNGHVYGHIGMRWIEADDCPVPQTRKVKLEELAAAVPGDARRVTPAERAEQIRRRRRGIDRRFRT